MPPGAGPEEGEDGHQHEESWRSRVLGFGIHCLGFRVLGFGLRVWGLRVLGLGIHCLGFRVFGLWVLGLGYEGFHGLGFALYSFSV